MLEQAAEIPEFVFASGTAVGVIGLRVDVRVELTVLKSPVVDVIQGDLRRTGSRLKVYQHAGKS
jgi:hypothetical protein